jgi:hypothetical protein
LGLVAVMLVWSVHFDPTLIVKALGLELKVCGDLRHQL